MRRFYTAESVTEGHPDKVCDQIADAILDECLRYDPSSRVACEVLATRGNVFVAGEITSGYEPPVFDVIRKVLEECGYCTDGIEMDTFVHQQSPDIAKAVSVSKEFRDNIGAKLRDRSRGAGDQGVMVGYACDDTPQLMPMPTVLAHRITRELSACRRSGYILIWNSRKCMKRKQSRFRQSLRNNVPSYSSLDMMGIFFPLWAMPQLF